MSPATAVPPVEDVTLPLIPLLKEYTRKFKSIARTAHSYWEEANTRSADAKRKVFRAEYKALRDLVQRLKPPATTLASHASQLLVHASLEVLNRIELSLRLAEFEGAIRAVDFLLETIPLTLQV